MGKLFGTDGIRGVAGQELTCELAFRVGQAAALVLSREGARHRPRFTIGKDTRKSSDMLECALSAGICSVGGDVLLLGVIPTPAVAYFTVETGADAGIVISASHNSFEHNGIKLFNSKGFKLPDLIEEEIEAVVLTSAFVKSAQPEDLGTVSRMEDGVSRYVSHVAGTRFAPLEHLRIAVDCANGASSRTAPELFSRLGVEAEFLARDPDGVNINRDCGSTALSRLCDKVREGNFHCGVAFDGDADRCLFVDDLGRPLDGDKIMAICGMFLKQQGRLRGDTIVATVMSNMGFHAYCRANGIHVVSAPVGDRYVLEEMLKGGYVLGGEQSGHLIFLEHTTTGDGELSAVQFLSLLAQSGRKLSELLDEIPEYPQVLQNVTVENRVKREVMEAPPVLEAVRRAEAAFHGEGRVLVRASGTEPLVRVMIEGRDRSEIEDWADKIAAVITSTARTL